MGRHSRSRKVQKKKEQGEVIASSSHDAEDDAGGSLMSLRSGFKSMAGTDEKKSSSKFGGAIGWIVFALLLVAVIFMFAKRF